MEEFNGRGYDTSPITGEEAAKFRHFFLTASQDWGLIRKLLTVLHALNIIYEVVKRAGPILAATAIIGFYLKTQGLV